MLKKTLFIFSFLLFTSFSFSQKVSVSGSVQDTIEKKNISNAVIALLTEKDSVLHRFTRSGKDGSFTIGDVAPGNYILLTTHPYYADLLDNISVKDHSTIKLGTLPLTSKSKMLQEVIIRSGSPIRIKGDTTIYTADSFKVGANANVEELLKKLPGIQVDKNGEIRAMGEKVEKVLVDGEEFFGDDPGMAVKNLRADAVKEVQVFDKKSDQAEFTGIDDGNTQKTINLKLKDDKKKGYFGKIDLTGGINNNPDNRFNNNILFSSFKGKRKLSAFLLNGNTGQDGLNWQDNEKYGGENDNISMSMDEDGGMMVMVNNGGSDEEPQVNTQNGFIKNTNAGISYSNKWNDKQTINFSPKYNNQIYNNNTGTYSRTYINADSLFDYNSNRSIYINRYNIKNNASYDLKIDSNNSIKLTLKGNFYHTESNEFNNSSTISGTSIIKNAVDKQLDGISNKQAYSANVIYKHKFKKARRTMSFIADWKLLNSENDNIVKSQNQFYNAGLPDYLVSLNRNSQNENLSNKLSAKAVYTEPLTKKYSLELGYEFSLNYGKNDQAIYNYTPGSGKYDDVVDSLTNLFEQVITINKPSFKINFSDKKVKFNFGSGFGLTHFNLDDITLSNNFIRNYTNFFPSATLTYTYKGNHSLRFNYYGNTSQPTINQLQPLRNNSDLFYEYKGNLELKPTFTNTFNISHNGYNFLKDLWMYQSFNINISSNSITNNRIIDLASGKTITTPINTNGNVYISLWSGLGFKSKKFDTRFNLSPNLSYNQFADFINSLKTISKNLSAGLNISASKSKDKKYDFTVSNDFRFNSNKTAQRSSSSKYSSNTLGLNATVYYKKTWSINSDYNYYWKQKIFEGSSNLKNHLLNVRLQKTLRNNEFTLYFLVRDIFNQNIGINRNFFGNTFTETRDDRLKRYWMIGFAWDFKNKAAKTTSTNSK